MSKEVIILELLKIYCTYSVSFQSRSIKFTDLVKAYMEAVNLLKLNSDESEEQ